MCCAPFTCAHWNFPFSSSWHWPPLLRQFQQGGNTFTSRVISGVNRESSLAIPTVLMFTGYTVQRQVGRLAYYPITRKGLKYAIRHEN